MHKDLFRRKKILAFIVILMTFLTNWQKFILKFFLTTKTYLGTLWDTRQHYPNVFSLIILFLSSDKKSALFSLSVYDEAVRT